MAIDSSYAIPTREEIFKIFSGTINDSQVSLSIEALTNYVNWQNSKFPFVVLSTDNSGIFIAFPYNSSEGFYICMYRSSSQEKTVYSLGRYSTNGARITKVPYQSML